MTPSTPQHYGGGSITPTAAGTFRASVYHAYRDLRKTCRTLDDAKAWIDSTVFTCSSERRPLDYHQTRDALQAMHLLPQGVTLTDAARFFASRHAPSASISVSDAVQQYRAECSKAGLRPRSLYAISSTLSRLTDVHGKESLTSIRPDNLLAILSPYTGRTRDYYRRTWSAFFSWAVRMSYADGNPCLAIPRPRTDQTMPEILTVAQSQRLLRSAAQNCDALVPYIATGLFAGLRAVELQRIDWRSIDAAKIHIGPDVAKTRQQRYVDISPNLRRWLDPFRARAGRLAPWSHKKLHEKLIDVRSAARIPTWPHNAMRHSFGTYHLALHQDAPATALQLGHRGIEVLFTHYRALATRAQGKAYFSIRP